MKKEEHEKIYPTICCFGICIAFGFGSIPCTHWIVTIPAKMGKQGFMPSVRLLDAVVSLMAICLFLYFSALSLPEKSQEKEVKTCWDYCLFVFVLLYFCWFCLFVSVCLGGWGLFCSGFFCWGFFSKSCHLSANFQIYCAIQPISYKGSYGSGEDSYATLSKLLFILCIRMKQKIHAVVKAEKYNLTKIRLSTLVGLFQVLFCSYILKKPNMFFGISTYKQPTYWAKCDVFTTVLKIPLFW